MHDLKPGYVRVFQCEECGVLTSQDGATHFAMDGRLCHGPITERILADPDVVREECANLIPTSWLDPLLTGPNAVIGEHPYDEYDIDNLLRSVRGRIIGAPRETDSDGGG